MTTLVRSFVVGWLAWTSALPAIALAQTQPPAELAPAVAAELASRPRIGLVLSGGGARGAAHVGVLEVLEELRVPVDAIAGTSMGAIVGGLYAAGLTPAELEQALTSVDWNRALTDKTSRDLLSFRRKQDDLSTAVKVRVGLKGWKPGLPLGIIQGQKLELLLRSLAFPAATVDDFDELVVPYRAVAADLATVRAVVLDKGDLVMAMRASMSVPLVFEPVEYEGGLLIDGGVADNLPVDVVRTMDVDVVIAVDIGSRLSKLEDLGSALAVNDQMVTGLMRRETDRQLASLGPDDIAIVPDLGDYTASDFTEAAGIIPIGEVAAREAADKLSRYALSPEAWAAHRAGLRRLGREEPKIESVVVEDDSDLSDKYIASLLTVEPGQTFDAAQVEKDVQRVFGLDLFERVGYVLHDAGPGEVDLEIETRRRSWGADYVQFGLAMRSNLENLTGFDVTLRLNKLAVTPTGGEWRTDLRLGENQLLRTEFYQPLTLRRSIFWAARASIRRQPVLIINEVGQEDLAYRLSLGGLGLDIGHAFDNWGELRVGFDRESGTFRETDVADLPAIDFEEARVYAFFGTDTFDDAAFPKNGVTSRVQASYSAEALGATDNLGRASFAVDYAATRDRHTLILGMQGASFFDDSKFALPYSLGGLGRLSGFGDGRLIGRYTFLTRAIYYGRVVNVGLSAIEMPIYVGGSLELGNAWSFESQVALDDLLIHGSVFLGIDSPLGPIYVGGGFGENDERSAFFLLGRTF